MPDYELVSDSSIGSSDAALLRHLTSMWLTTGIVPVAHMVAEPDDADLVLCEEDIASAAESFTGQRRRAPSRRASRPWRVWDGVAQRVWRRRTSSAR